ncbi:MAG: HEAT repeat domain-containing protein [Leptospirales bacterium]|nr:HEAT repeat domain-containing protein [Leptospirales bacterium]
MIRFAASTERRAGMRKVIALNEQERQRFYPVLEEMASKDLDFAVRETAIRVLGEMRHRSSQAVFIAALRDENRDVIRAAVAALSHDPPAEAGAALEELARKEEYAENNQLLVSVINLLGELKRREMASFFKEKSDDPRTHSEIRLAITLFYGRAGAVEMKDHLLGVLRNEQLDPTTRSFAANALGRLGDRSVASPIREELNKIRALSNSRERAALSSFKLQLLGALVRLGDEEVNAEILAAARDDDGRVRLRAVRQIGEIRLQAARPLLEYIAANDSGPRIRAAARAAIKRLDGATGEDESDRDAPETSENSSASGAEGAP